MLDANVILNVKDINGTSCYDGDCLEVTMINNYYGHRKKKELSIQLFIYLFVILSKKVLQVWK